MLFAAISLLVQPGHAQCGVAWQPGQGVPGIEGVVRCLHWWDPDGAGPASRVLVVGGSVSIAGDVLTKGLAAWDPATGTWSAFGSGLDAGVWALATLPNGDLVAGTVGTLTSGIHRWDGTSWTALGGGIAGSVQALAIMPNGDLLAGGAFAVAGGVPATSIARWNGVTWAAVGGALGAVSALAVRPNGEITAAHTGLGRISRWTGGAWETVGVGLGFADQLFALAFLPNGDLVIGGAFTQIGTTGARGIARWNGSQWSALGGGVAGPEDEVMALQVLADGSLVAGGNFTVAGGTPIRRIARWNGSSWSSFDSGMDVGVVFALTQAADGSLQAGGWFRRAGATPAAGVASWNGAAWSALSAGINGVVEAVLDLPSGEIVIGGSFTAVGGVVANGIARWNGSTWAALGSGCNGTVNALQRLPNGDLVAAGTFTTMGGQPALRIARWDGAAWTQLGDGLEGPATCLALAPNGDLIVGGGFFGSGGPVFTPGWVLSRLAIRWDGAAWQPMDFGSQASNGDVVTLAVTPSGELVAGGLFDGRVARWTGTNWQPLGALTGYVGSLVALPNGDIVAGTLFDNSGNNVHRWTGSAWTPFGIAGLYCRELARLPGGDLMASFSTQFTAPTPHFLSRWNGATWQPQLGIAGTSSLLPAIHVLKTMADGQLAIGGQFWTAGGALAVNFTRLATTCPASRIDAGAGCPSSGGDNALSSGLPWLGEEWRSQVTGLPSQALVFAVVGSAPASVPLPQVFPSGQSGCVLQVQPDYVEGIVPVGGAASLTIALPAATWLLGQSLYHQMLPLQLDATLALTASNAVRLTIGSW